MQQKLFATQKLYSLLILFQYKYNTYDVSCLIMSGLCFYCTAEPVSMKKDAYLYGVLAAPHS